MKHIISNFKPIGGSHCITNSLKQIFYFNNYPITEEMLFGIGYGLSFVYINLKDAPMISGRIKPLEFEENIASALNISIKCRQSKNPELATKKLRDQIKSNIPIMIYADIRVYAQSEEDLLSFVTFCSIVQGAGDQGAGRPIKVMVDGDGSGRYKFEAIAPDGYLDPFQSNYVWKEKDTLWLGE